MPSKSSPKKRVVKKKKPSFISQTPTETSEILKKENYFGTIEVNVISLESQVETGTFTLTIAYGDQLVGNVNPVIVPRKGGTVNIRKKFFLHIKSTDNYVMDALLSTPFFFSMLKGVNRQESHCFQEFGYSPTIKIKVIGQGNLTLLPLLTGQAEMESFVVLEPPGFQETMFYSRMYSEHPKLLIKLTDTKRTLSSIRMHNIMWLSVESIYNVDATNFMLTADHTMVFPLPSTSIAGERFNLKNMLVSMEETDNNEIKQEDKKTIFARRGKPRKKSLKVLPTKSSPQPILKNKTINKKSKIKRVVINKCPDFDLIQFDRGIYLEEPTIDIRKKWSSLASINGAPAMTNYRIQTNGNDLLTQIPLDLSNKFKRDNEPRIEWNMVRPIWLHEELEKNFKNRILRYGVWPFELVMLGKIYVEPKQISGKLRSIIIAENKRCEAIREKIDNVVKKFYNIIKLADETKKSFKKTSIQRKNKLSKLKAKMKKILLKQDKHWKRSKRKVMQLEAELIAKINKKKRKKSQPEVKRGKSLVKEKSDVEQHLGEEPDIENIEKGISKNAVILLEKKAYIAWVDLSPLLSPGCTHLRTTGLLQFFNKEEAIAKWGLTTTLSAEPDEMVPKDKELSRAWRSKPKELMKVFRLVRKSKLLKNPSRILLLLGRLMDLKYKRPFDIDNKFFEDSTPVRTKITNQKNKNKITFRRKRVRFGEFVPKKHIKNGDSKDFLINESGSIILKKDSSKQQPLNKGTNMGVYKEEIDNSSLSGLSNVRTYNFCSKSPENQPSLDGCFTSKIHGSKRKKKRFKDQPHGLPIGMNKKCNVPMQKTVNCLPILKCTNQHCQRNKNQRRRIKKSSFKNSETQTFITCKLEKGFLKSLKNQINTLTDALTSQSKHISQLDSTVHGKVKVLINDLISKLYTVMNRYCRLKERYNLLRSVKRGSENVIKNIQEKRKYFMLKIPKSSKKEIKRIEPRHKMWHVGKRYGGKIMKHQIQVTNVIRKLAVLERKFLLLKRFRLTEMKRIWQEKVCQIVPEYLKNKKGKHVFVIIDIKLLKPFVAKPSLNKIELDINNFIRDNCNKKKQVYHVNDSLGDFHDCIIYLTKIITSEYQDYKTLYSSEMEPLSNDHSFYDYLEKSRAHQVITESLSQAMISYLSATIGDSIPLDFKADQKKLRYYVGWLYTRLVDEMQSIVNSLTLDCDRSQPISNTTDLPNISSQELFLFAVEAIEEMDYDRAKYYLAKRLEGQNKTHPLNWIDYAVIALRIGDYQLALECIKEALAIDSRCKEGLVMYAVMLMMEGKFEDAQLFFTALISFYPMFVEGWMAFHMFYLIVENKIGADITLVAGTKINRDHKVPPPYKPIQLSWDNEALTECEPGNYMSTAVYFLSFNLYEIAEVCLAQELERVGSKNAVWVYYLAVCHYIQGRYEDSAKHLVRSITEAFSYNTNPRIWILLGHNCWQMGMKKCAVRMYLQAFTENDIVKYAHMTYIRCGFFFLDNEQAEFGKQMFFHAVKEKGTPMGWLGLGIAYFMAGEMDDAELALKEANLLDTTMATAWGYLALISLYRLKQEQFLHCFQEAKRYGLKDKKLALQIEIIGHEILSHRKITEKVNEEKKKSLLHNKELF